MIAILDGGLGFHTQLGDNSYNHENFDVIYYQNKPNYWLSQTLH